MSKSKTITIAFRAGGIVPADKSATGFEKRVGPHEPVKVEEAYGRSLIADKFAVEASGDAKAPSGKKGDGGADKALAAAKKEAESIIGAAKTEAESIVEKATQEAKAEAGKIVDAAKAEAETIVDTAKAQAAEIGTSGSDEGAGGSSSDTDGAETMAEPDATRDAGADDEQASAAKG